MAVSGGCFMTHHIGRAGGTSDVMHKSISELLEVSIAVFKTGQLHAVVTWIKLCCRRVYHTSQLGFS